MKTIVRIFKVNCVVLVDKSMKTFKKRKSREILGSCLRTKKKTKKNCGTGVQIVHDERRTVPKEFEKKRKNLDHLKHSIVKIG